MWYDLARVLLFSLDPEISHEITLGILKRLSKLDRLCAYRMRPYIRSKSLFKPPIPSKEITCFGLKFLNPIGLAAGLDKNADCLAAWSLMGFGFIEVGTVTPKAQVGNTKPRLFRLVKDKALINRMGFNNKGVGYVSEQLKAFPRRCPVGVNIGKNRDTPLHEAFQDYLYCYKKVYPYADYVTLNLSSPNTPDLKSLQHGQLLRSIIIPLIEERKRLTQDLQKYVPVLVKISPDITNEEIKLIVDELIALQVDGIIATNTTVKRDSTLKCNAREEGGLSGAPLYERATEVVKLIYDLAGSKLPIIAVGGISNSEQAKAKLAAGAKLLQLYTGLIYQGPSLVETLVSELSYISPISL